jgi:curved DNA-binding protein CbpA
MSNYFDSHEYVFNNFYDILEVNEDSTIEQIRKNYLKLAKKHHPDQGGNSEMFELISQAYECLSKPDFRKNYDLEYNNMKDDGFKTKQSIDYLKYEFEDFKKKNNKTMSDSELDNVYNNLFKNSTIDKDMAFKSDDFTNKIMDIKTEREMNEIEFTDDYYKNIIEKNDLNINDVFEFLKNDNKQQIINKPITPYDLSVNNTELSYSSFIDNNNISSDLNNLDINFDIKENNKNFDIGKFTEWKQTKKNNTKITTEDIDKYMKQRNEIEKEITSEIENNFKDYKKKSDIEKFMKLENKINTDDLFLMK